MDLLDQLEAAEDSQVSFTSPEPNKPREPWPVMACVRLVKPVAAWVLFKKIVRGWVVVEKADLKQYLFHSWAYLISVHKSRVCVCAREGEVSCFLFPSVITVLSAILCFVCHLDQVFFCFLFFFPFPFTHNVLSVIYSTLLFLPSYSLKKIKNKKV